MFCLKESSSEKEKRYITINNYHQLGLTNDEYILPANQRICCAYRLSKGIPKYRKKCVVINLQHAKKET